MSINLFEYLSIYLYLSINLLSIYQSAFQYRFMFLKVKFSKYSSHEDESDVSQEFNRRSDGRMEV